MYFKTSKQSKNSIQFSYPRRFYSRFYKQGHTTCCYMLYVALQHVTTCNNNMLQHISIKRSFLKKKRNKSRQKQKYSSTDKSKKFQAQLCSPQSLEYIKPRIYKDICWSNQYLLQLVKLLKLYNVFSIPHFIDPNTHILVKQYKVLEETNYRQELNNQEHQRHETLKENKITQINCFKKLNTVNLSTGATV
eukprot:TRINITY_DN2374_c0_g1_i10.p4 TRINITY_DN2374_c0_g1~~TRINITY_DN2374_c0_g1_i10.p4  ORF type:complete len:191 (+),score=-11.67 TRINITY_DN2374_c0_g1_i10:935-1507(+)